MGQEKPTAELYDFLYRDSGRIVSYYAQLFGGHLSTVEETDLTKQTVDKSGKFDVHLASGEIKTGNEIHVGAKRTLNPHDLIATDVLTALKGRFLKHSLSEAPHGSIILSRGTLIFIDRHVTELAATIFDALLEDEEAKHGKQRNRTTIRNLRFIRAFLKGVILPSAFLLQSDDGVQVAGTLKDEGMEEPISAYYFKHGTAGLSEVYLVGVKELPSPAFEVPEGQLMGTAQQVAQNLSDMLFPKDAIRVTPIAIFRKL